MPMSHFSKSRRDSIRRLIGASLVLLYMVLLGGCSHWHPTLVAESEIPFSDQPGVFVPPTR